MKIVGPAPGQATSVRRRDGTRPAGGGFSVDLAADAQPRASAGVNQAESVNGLFSLQEIEDEGDASRRRARQRGEDILDRLDEIRHGLLAGRLQRDRVAALLDLVRRQKARTHDPRLMQIIDEIELRAEVELAKLDPLT